jgi:hypothetical protein
MAKRKMTNNALQNIMQKTKDRATNPTKTQGLTPMLKKGKQFLLH